MCVHAEIVDWLNCQRLTKIQEMWMWELDYKESWEPKNGCFGTVVLEKTLQSHSDYKEIQPVPPKGNQSWTFTGRTDAEDKAPLLWPPDAKNWLFGKDPDAGKDWRQEEKGTTEDGLVGWHHQLDGHGFEQALGVGDGQGGLACCSPWGHKGSDMTEQPNNKNGRILNSMGLAMIEYQLDLLEFWANKTPLC